MRDLKITQAVSQATDITSKKLKGHIQMICHDPFYVLIYNETTLKKYRKTLGKLHIDATGSVVKKCMRRPCTVTR